jgi:hypothetical protein
MMLPAKPRIWQLMVIVGLMAILCVFVLRRDPDTGITQAVGHARVQLHFHVCDAESGLPIDGATIWLVDSDWVDNTTEPHLIVLKTGRDGSASKALELGFGFTQGIPSGRYHSFRGNYPPWQMRVDAEGYTSVRTWFRDYEVGDKRFHENRPPRLLSVGFGGRPSGGGVKLAVFAVSGLVFGISGGLTVS